MKRTRLVLAIATATLLSAAMVAAQPNLVPNLPGGWAWPVVPRPTNDATSGSVPAPTHLMGEQMATYLNSAWRNFGTVASGSFHNNTVLDGERIIVDRACASLAAGASGHGINGGPFAVLGGRHTLELRVDAGGVVAESDETDNNIAHQWIWDPGILPAGLYGYRSAPPDPQGGWSAIPAGEAKYDNCDGIEFTVGAGWDVLFEWGFEPTADYDLRLFERTTGASTGFSSPLAASTRRGRGVEALIANGHNVGTNTYDAGIVRYAGSGDYRFEHLASQALAWDDSVTVTFGQDEMLKLFDVAVPLASDISIWLQTATTDPSVVLMWVDRAFTTGGLTDITATAATDAAGRARLDVTTNAAGNYAVIVFRDPDWGTGPRSFGLKVAGAMPDLVPYAPAGWHSPVVPRRTDDGTPTSVALPDTLPAYNTGPFVNWCVRNTGGAACPSTSLTRFLVDGTQDGDYLTPALAAGGNFYHNPTSGIYELHAGRHTLSIHADSGAAVPEITQDNNAYGEQYCWAPVTTAMLGDMGWDPSPPPLSGGWEDVAVGSGETFWFNNLARRLPTAPSGVWWQGYVIAPLPGNDYDLQLHEALRGAKNGLGEALSASHWGSNQTDYVLVNLNQTTRRPFDVSVLNYGGTQSFHPQYVESTTLGTAGTLAYAPYTSSGIDMMQLREWYFSAGYWIIHLKNLSVGDKYGMTFHQADEVYTGKRVAASVYPSGGGDLWLQVQVVTPGWCCLAVWIQDYASIGTMRYQLSMSPGGTPVPDDGGVPAATAFAGACPNPFNPKTTVAFDLAATGRARLAIYDLRGALVRRLVDADLAPGRHEVAWDGRDTAERSLPSGTYVARLEAGGVVLTQKLTLVR